MSNFFAKFRNTLGIEDTDYDQEYLDDQSAVESDEIFSDSDPMRPAPRARKREQGNVVTLPNSNAMKMIVFHPMNNDDTQHIIDNLKSRKPVVINMEHLTRESATRILDFVSGAVYALNGTMCKVSQGIFIAAPTNIDILGDHLDEE